MTSGTRSRSTTPRARPANPKGVVYHHRGAYLSAIGTILAGNIPRHPTLPADRPAVSLQRVVFPLGHRGAGRHRHLPPQGGAGRHPRTDPRAPGDPLRRRSDRAQHAAERAGRAVGGNRSEVVGLHCRRRPAAGDDRGDGAARRRAGPCVRTYRDLRTGDDLRAAGGMAPAPARARRRNGSGGRASVSSWRRDWPCSIRKRCSRCPRTDGPWAR